MGLIDDTIRETTLRRDTPTGRFVHLGDLARFAVQSMPAVLWVVGDRKVREHATPRLAASVCVELYDADAYTETDVLNARTYAAHDGIPRADLPLPGVPIARVISDRYPLASVLPAARLSNGERNPGPLGLLAHASGGVAVLEDDGRWPRADIVALVKTAQRGRWRRLDGWIAGPRVLIVSSAACACGGADVCEVHYATPSDRDPLSRATADPSHCECGPVQLGAWARRATSLRLDLAALGVEPHSLRLGSVCAPCVDSRW